MMPRILFCSVVALWGFVPSLGHAFEPTFDERLEKLAAEIERNRIEHHAPGAAVAIVRGGEVVFARGFGLADIENETPATTETNFFIGSTTKAFTATLIGMLVDEGKMSWDDPVAKYLPYFELDVDSEDDDARATLRDIMSHRTGFPRMSMLWANGALTSDEILHQAAGAEPYAPFREKFYYNNVMFLAAGWAGAAAGGKSWADLIDERIFTPLGMANSRTTIRGVRGMRGVARGYAWDENIEDFRADSAGPESAGVDPVGPAGSISSNALDMAQWLQFLLAGGVVEGNRLISEDALEETWTEHIEIGGGVGYGLGWMLHEWQGQPMIEHGGAVPGGFSAEVALMPESDLGFVLLTNSYPTLFPNIFINLVPEILLGKWVDDEAEGEAEEFGPYIGKYIANFAAFSNETFTVLERNGHLALDVPSQMIFDLKPPDADGKWQFALTDQIALAFDRNDAGDVVGLRMFQSGMEFEVIREGIEIEPEIDLDELHKYLGSYEIDSPPLEVSAIIQNNRLAIQIAGGPVFDLHPPDGEGRWVSRANAELSVVFEETENGEVIGFDFSRPGGAPLLTLTAADKIDSALPSVAELIALRGGAAGGGDSTEIESTRSSGVVRFPQAAVEGRFVITTGGDDRLRIVVDLGRFAKIQVALDGERGWRDSGLEMEPFMELKGKMLEQTRQGHPAALYGDWREFFDSVSVLREGEVGGRKVYVVKLESGDVPATKIGVDAETGDVLKVEQTIIVPGLGGLASITLNEDFREVSGMRVPFRSVESNEQTGQTVYEVENFEINVDLEEDVFVMVSPDEQ